MRVSRARRSGRTGACSQAARRIASSSAVRPWLALKLPRSKNGSPIPAYSQSTIRMRRPSSMKFPLSRSLWHGRISTGSARNASSMRRPTACARSYSGGIGTLRASASARYASTIRSGMNNPGMAGPVVDAADRIGDPTDRFRTVDRLVRDRRALDELRHEVAAVPDERRHLRSHAHTGRGHGRRVLDLPADAQQVRVVAGQPDDVAFALAGELDEEVAVRDPAGERGEGHLPAGDLGHDLERRDEVLFQGHIGLEMRRRGDRSPRRRAARMGATVSR